MIPKQYSEYDAPDKVQTLTRKVATGPSAPHYKGKYSQEIIYVRILATQPLITKVNTVRNLDMLEHWPLDPSLQR